MGEPGRPIAGLVLVEAPPPTVSYHHLAPGLAVAVDYTLEWLPGGYHLFEPADRRGTFAAGQLSRDGETVETVDFEGGALPWPRVEGRVFPRAAVRRYARIVAVHRWTPG